MKFFLQNVNVFAAAFFLYVIGSIIFGSINYFAKNVKNAKSDSNSEDYDSFEDCSIDNKKNGLSDTQVYKLLELNKGSSD